MRDMLIKFMVVTGYRLPHTKRDNQRLNREANSSLRLNYKRGAR